MPQDDIQQIQQLKARLDSLERRYNSLKGDGSGIERQGDTLSFRAATPSQTPNPGAQGYPLVIDGVCINGVAYTVTFLVTSQIAE